MRIFGKFCAAAVLGLTLSFFGCHKQSDNNTAQTEDQQNPNYDPASANMAPVDQSPPVNESTPSAASTSSTSAQPSQTAASSSDNVPDSSYPADNTVPATEISSDQSGYYDTAAVEQPVYAPEPPPPLPVYDQPPCPGPNYIWTPGYWGYQPTGYYWVPGVWVIAPYIGALWTPGYWGWLGGHYRWNHGYWGPHIGYYGGINYGHGYVGSGYYGGYWNHNNFYYNRAITNVNTAAVRNVYVHNVTINNYNTTRVSYNGGRGGIMARPTPAELQASREQHMPPLTAQTMHARQASQDRAQLFNVNKGRPQTVALNRPLATPFHAPAAQPPVRGVANPGLAERTAANRPNNEVRPMQPQQHAENKPGAMTQNRPQPQAQQQHPNLIRPQAHPENTLRTEQQRRQAQPQPEQQRPQSQARPEAQRPQPQTRPEPQARPEVQREQQRPQPEQRPQPQARPEVQRQQPHSQPEQRPQPQARPEAQREQPRPQQEARPQSRPESRPQEQPHEEHPHLR